MSVSEALETAFRLQGAGDITRAEFIYRAILVVQPEHPDALHLLGVVMMRRHDTEAAIDLIGRAIAARPAIAMYHNNLGKAYRNQERYADALAQFRRALELEPGLTEALYNSGEALQWSGRSAEAVAIFNRITTLHPFHSAAYVRKGETLQKEGHIEEALSCYRQAIAAGPDKSWVYFEVGCALAATDRHDEAIRHHEKAIALSPSWTAPHLRLAHMHKDAGRIREAMESCRRALALAPADAFALHLLNTLEGKPTARASAEYVRKLFDKYADHFDKALLERLDYQTPTALAAVLRSCNSKTAGGQDVLDLGCGTGLMGIELRDVSRRLVGVDLSPKMLAKAKERRIYDQLLEGDLVECMAQFSSGSFDAVVAADVFVYVGDLALIFNQCLRLMRPGARFAFSVEHLRDDAADFVLALSQRFKHSHGYVDRLCAHYRLSMVHREVCHIRKERGNLVEGCLYLLMKS